MKKCYGWIALFFIISSPLWAHIGSPGVIHEEQIGDYRVLVNVDPPDVIPGTAYVTVFLQGSPSGVSMQAKPIFFSTGKKGTPNADPLLASAEDPNRFEGEIWLMSSGTWSIALELEGPNGNGEINVPIMAVSTAKREMQPGLGLALSLLGIFLVILLVTIVIASVSDALVKPGKDLPSSMRRRRLYGMLIGTSVIVLILWGGKSWWDSWAANYQARIYQPIQGSSKVIEENDQLKLQLNIDLENLNFGKMYRRMSYLVPDHGKLMHLFLIREEGYDAFAHLHPLRIDTSRFETYLPPLPEGRYLLFADVTRYNGFAETIVDTVNIPAPSLFRKASDLSLPDYMDPDDTYTTTDPIGSFTGDQNLDAAIQFCGKPGMMTDLPGGYKAIWEQEEGQKYRAGKLYNLNFTILDPEKNPAKVESYLGMMGHAVVLRHEGGVYIHLHPVGNYSMGSQQMMEERFKREEKGWKEVSSPQDFADSIDRVLEVLNAMSWEEREELLGASMDHDWESEDHKDHVISFPYAFPQPGNYRVWIQVKVEGRIINGAFDVEVS